MKAKKKRCFSCPVSDASRNASGIPRGQACPPEQTDTNRIRMNDEQAATSPSGHIEAQRAGVEICQWHIDGRRELSCSYLAGRRSRPDRREGCHMSFHSAPLCLNRNFRSVNLL